MLVQSSPLSMTEAPSTASSATGAPSPEDESVGLALTGTVELSALPLGQSSPTGLGGGGARLRSGLRLRSVSLQRLSEHPELDSDDEEETVRPSPNDEPTWAPRQARRGVPTLAASAPGPLTAAPTSSTTAAEDVQSSSSSKAPRSHKKSRQSREEGDLPIVKLEGLPMQRSGVSDVFDTLGLMSARSDGSLLLD